MKVATAQEMRRIDKEAIEGYGMPGLVLMERAGLSVATRVRDLFDKKKVLVLAGSGNNGGDGIVAARNLSNWGWHVQVVVLSDKKRLSPDCLTQYEIAKKMGVSVEFRSTINARDVHGAIVLDAVLGTGISKPVGPPLSGVIAFLNGSGADVLSVDIPSGISSDTGQVMGAAVRADYTVTFGLPKVGHLLPPGLIHSGKLFIEEIGFPRELLASDVLATEAVGKSDAAVLLPERPENSYKNDYGHVLVIAGSRGKTGAPLMTAMACLRAGAGMVTIGVPETLVDIFQARVTEEMVLPLPDTGKGVLSESAYVAIRDFLNARADVLAMGPGLTTEGNVVRLVKKLLETTTVPMVLDADALNCLAAMVARLGGVKAPVVLTPHEGEMARLLKGRDRKAKSRGEIPEVDRDVIRLLKSERITRAADFARDTGAYLVLKGAPSIVADPEGKTFINTTGNAGMATAGSGDVLTGIIAAFIGQGLSPRDAAVLGVYVHGLAGDAAASCKGAHSLIAGDIISHLPAAFGELREV